MLKKLTLGCMVLNLFACYPLYAETSHSIVFQTQLDRGLDLSFFPQQGSKIMTKDPLTGQIHYTSHGNFLQYDDGYFYQDGYRLQGITNDKNSCSITDVKRPQTRLSNQPSSFIVQTVNLNANASTPHTKFDYRDPAAFNYQTELGFIDNQGKLQRLKNYFVKTNFNQWDVHVLLNNHEVTTGKLYFSANGQFKSADKSLQQIVFSSDHATQTINLVLDDSTQYASEFQSQAPIFDGYPQGYLVGVSVKQTGQLIAHYSNLQNISIGQIVLN